jgi:hypothetical protein
MASALKPPGKFKIVIAAVGSSTGMAYQGVTDLTIYQDGPWCSFVTKEGAKLLTNRNILIEAEK